MVKTFRRGSKRGATTTSSSTTTTCFQTIISSTRGSGGRKLREIARIDNSKSSKSEVASAVEERQGSGSPEDSFPSITTSAKRKRRRGRRRRTEPPKSCGNSCTSTSYGRPPFASSTRHNQQTRSRGLAFSSIATASSSEYAQFSERMGEHHSHHGSLGLHQLALHQQQQQREQRAQTHSRLGRLRAAGGEIVEVQGGHIVRSTGRKDRHSKVCTAKGPRDRRVRLSAHTAIQFYDVQDRLGYDRPSKAVDWLIKNAKAAIDQLAELPAAWIPTAAVTADAAATSTSCAPPSSRSPATEHPSGESSKKLIPVSMPDFPTAFSFGGPKGTGGSISFLPPSLDSDHIADTIKSFFPMAAAGGTTISPSSIPSIGFHNYPSDLLSRTSGRTQDLRLSLQSFQDHIFHNAQSNQQHHSPTPAHRSLLAGSSHLGFDAASPGWAEQNQRVSEWNVAETSGGAGLYGFAFNVPPLQAVPLHSVLGPSQFLTQRGPLQSSNSPSVRGWADPVAPTSELHMQPVLHPSAASIGFTSEADFSGFHVPARIQGEEEHGDVPDKPPSATSASCQ